MRKCSRVVKLEFAMLMNSLAALNENCSTKKTIQIAKIISPVPRGGRAVRIVASFGDRTVVTVVGITLFANSQGRARANSNNAAFISTRDEQRRAKGEF